MIFLLSIIKLLIIFLLPILLFKININKKSIGYLLIIFILDVLLYLFIPLNNLFIGEYNIIPMLLDISSLLLLIPIIKAKKEHIILIIFSLIDPLIKLLLSNALNIPFIELTQSGYYYFSLYIAYIDFFIKLFFIIFIKLILNMKYSKDLRISLFIYLGEIIMALILIIIVNYSLISIVFKDVILFDKLLLINLGILIILAFIAAFNIILLKSTINKEKQIASFKENKLYNEYNNIYIESQENLFKIKHDISNLVNTLKEYNEELSIEVANVLDEKINTNPKIYYTDNKLLNAILVNKINEIKKYNISINTNIKVDKISIESSDLISLITNIIDNAINATIHADNSYINIDIISQDTLEITIKNSYNDEYIIKRDDPQYHGYGIKIIKDIVKKYNGEYQTEKTKSTYFCHIKIKNG